MKICHVTCVHPRYDIRIFEKECVSLARRGYETYLVVNDDKPNERLKGVHILSTGFKPLNRKERFLKSAKAVLETALSVEAEIYQLHDPELLRIADKFLKRGKKVIFDAHEDTEAQIRDKSWIPSMVRVPVAKLYGLYSHRKMKELDGIITVTPSFVEKFKQYNVNTVMVTNYPIINIEETFEDVSGENKYIFFAGGLSTQWCHEKIAEAVVKVDNNIEYYFAGLGVTDYIKKICLIGEGKAKYCGRLSHDEVMRYYSGSCAGMAILDCVQVGIDGTLGNTKLFEVMQAGKPVICSDLRLWREIIERYKCGICVNSKDIDSIADAVRYVITHPDEAKQMGENGKKAVTEKYNWTSQEKTLLEFYEKIIEKTNCNSVF